ncbi:hypothetical protein W97_02076 [Coniosporium apollinis CBS 100218]|uniref:SAP domain-containing protein n=1 Tax=Coniosporium apollinis (strain CBS 100218) TaxID=1168221 RepID=R7YMG7_CONA1|nr:uncharacterized protein W97_02076 [Coniosporium apollinis CBS 100218]EON62851.1 hypothetical protein W97_02076 [Coniosporium apollinis CBS 100218]
MAAPFAKLKNSGLRRLLTLVGAPITGTKPILLARLQQKLETSTLPSHRQGTGTTRILSIDMGIKNLAYCVVDVKLPPSTPSTASKSTESKTEDASPAPQDPPTMTLTTWRRIAVLPLPSTTSPPSSPSATSIHTPTPPPPGKPEPGADPYHPRALAQTAHTLLTTLLLPHAPHTLLIERQRYRSGGGAAVQDWTYRVNMLEGMLWAVLRTLQSERAGRGRKGKRKVGKVGKEEVGEGESDGGEGPEVWDVSPARVMGFWVGDGRGREKGAKGKREKVGLVGRWVGGERVGVAVGVGGAGGGAEGTGIRMEFSGEAESARKAFVGNIMEGRGSRKGSATKKPRAKRRKKVEDQEDTQILVESVSVADSKAVPVETAEDIRKLDDLADCLLQAAAWVQWEANRRRIAEMDEQEVLRLIDEHTGS